MLQSIFPRGRAATVPGGGCPPAAAILTQGHQRQGGGSLGGLGGATTAELPELPSILVPSEQVEHRIQAAIGTGQRPGHFIGHVDNVQHPAISFQQPRHVINGAGDVERHEADSKDSQHHRNGAESTQTRRRLGSPWQRPIQAPGHEPIADKSDQAGHAEEQPHDY